MIFYLFLTRKHLGWKDKNEKLIANYLDKWLISYLSGTCQTFAGSRLSNVQIYCFSQFYLIVNQISLSFGLLAKQNQQFEDVISDLTSLFI